MFADARNIGERMVLARYQKRLTSTRVGQRMGVRPDAIRNVENGVRSPTLEWIFRYAVAVGVAPSSLDDRLTDRVVKTW